jgi:hypothetical protein
MLCVLTVATLTDAMQGQASLLSRKSVTKMSDKSPVFNALRVLYTEKGLTVYGESNG